MQGNRITELLAVSGKEIKEVVDQVLTYQMDNPAATQQEIEDFIVRQHPTKKR